MKRKNKDWGIVLEDGYPKDLLNLLQLELNKEGIVVFWDDYDCSFAATDYLIDNTFNTCDTDQVKSMINSSCTKSFKIPSQWKEAKEYILEEEKKLPDTGWLKHKHGSLVNRTGPDTGYGFSCVGDWNIDKKYNFVSNPEEWAQATEEEVKEVLIKNAKKIGYKVGDKIRMPWNNVVIELIESIPSSNEYKLYPNHFYFNSWCIMHNGQWAEIINELTIDSDNTYISFNKVCNDDSMRVLCTVIKNESDFLDSLKNFEIIIKEKS